MNPNRSLHRLARVREHEAALLARLPAGEAMRRAGVAAAERIHRWLGGEPARVLVLCGPGNNGGDGLVCAAALARDGHGVTVAIDDAPRTDDARAALAALPASVRRVVSPLGEPADVIVDALFGLGLTRPPGAPWADWISDANARPDASRIALDLPSGLDADQGVAAESCFRAHRTLTFLLDKPGLHTGDGADHAGQVTLLPLDDAPLPSPCGLLDDPALLADALASLARRQNSHKGRFGTVTVVGGSAGLGGALVLALRATLMLGAGRVRGGFVDGTPVPFDALHPETMLTDAQHAIRGGPTVVAIGPGLGDAHGAQAAVAAALDTDLPVLLDADALNIVAADTTLRERCAARPAPTAITPHPLEAARLLGLQTPQVQAERLDCALRLARELNAASVLKGAGSVVAAPDGRFWICTTGSPSLATGGSGDVLTGIVAALMGQLTREQASGQEGLEGTLAALRLGVWLHGRAGEIAAERHGGPLGTAAGELIPLARASLNELMAAASRHNSPFPLQDDIPA